MSPEEILYHRYLTLCAEVGHPPVPFAGWLLLLEEVPWKFPMGFPLSKKPIDTGAAAYRKPKRPDAEVLADVLASRPRLFIGELRPDGSIVPVRREPEVRTEKTPLTARTCRGACQQYLPIERFSKQGRGYRAVCKKCDNARRRA